MVTELQASESLVARRKNRGVISPEVLAEQRGYTNILRHSPVPAVHRARCIYAGSIRLHINENINVADCTDECKRQDYTNRQATVPYNYQVISTAVSHRLIWPSSKTRRRGASEKKLREKRTRLARRNAKCFERRNAKSNRWRDRKLLPVFISHDFSQTHKT